MKVHAEHPLLEVEGDTRTPHNATPADGAHFTFYILVNKRGGLPEIN